MELRLGLAVLAVLVIVIIATISISRSRKRVHDDPNSLYNRLGGIYAISAVVDDFSDALIKNPIVGEDSPNHYLRDWNRNKLGRLPGLKTMRTLWVAALAGGPFRYSATKAGRCPFSLENAHSQFQISSEEFDEVARELEKSLGKFKVGEREKKEVLSVFAAHKPEVVQGIAAPGKCPFLSRVA
jgi:hemoglobin